MLDILVTVPRRQPRPVSLLTIRDAAEILGVSLPTLRRWDASGRFRARRHPFSNYRLYLEADVLRLRKRIESGARAD
jgi:excisionase family DNA binding protein